MQQSTELLVATLVYIKPERDADALVYIRFINETIRRATGLVTSSFYRSREQRPSYFLLSTWEDAESWQRARERYNPLALSLAQPDLLARHPEQWYLSYRWGYSRPARQQTVATTHITTVQADTFEATHTAWLQELRKQTAQFMLAFGFLAYGVAHTQIEHHPVNTTTETTNADLIKEGNVLLTFISWPSDTERVAFYRSDAYQKMSAIVGQKSNTHVLILDPP